MCAGQLAGKGSQEGSKGLGMESGGGEARMGAKTSKETIVAEVPDSTGGTLECKLCLGRKPQ